MKDSILRITHYQGLTLLLALLCLASLIVYWDFLVLSKAFLFKDIGSDTINYLYPKYYNLAEYLRTEGFPGWSFNQGMGQYILPRSIGNPFELALYLMGPDNLIYGLAYIEVLKIILTGIIFYLYLRTLSLLPIVSVIGGLMFAFSAFVILGGTWHIFSIDALYMAILLYGFERILKDNTWWYFTIGIALVASNVSFNLYPYTLFLIPYMILRCNDADRHNIKDILKLGGKLLSAGLLGIGISAIFFIPNLLEMLNSSRVLGEASTFDSLNEASPLQPAGVAHNITAISRFFSSDLLGTGSNFSGWYNYLEAPMLYCGLLSLLLAPQVFVQINNCRKIVYFLFFLLFTIPIAFPYFRYLFWAFSGDYYRLFSIVVAFVFIFFSLHALDHGLRGNAVSLKLLVFTLILLLILLYLPRLFINNPEIISNEISLVATGLLLAYASLIFLTQKRRFQGPAILLLVSLICIELTGFSWITVNNRAIVEIEEHHSHTGYNDYSNDAIAKIKSKDPGLYRIEKTYSSGPAIHTSLNDAMVQNYYGTKTYNSFNHISYIRFLDAVNAIDGTNGNRWINGLTSDPLLLSFASVKYLLTKSEEQLRNYMSFGFRGIEKIGDVYIMINTFSLPFGFVYNSYIDEDVFLTLSKNTKTVTLLNAVILDPTDENPQNELLPFDYKSISHPYDSKSYTSNIRKLGSESLNISEFSHNRIKGEVELSESGLLFFSIPYEKNWGVRVNGAEDNLIRANVGFSGVMLKAGKNSIELTYNRPYFIESIICSILSLIIFCFAIIKTRKFISKNDD